MAERGGGRSRGRTRSRGGQEQPQEPRRPGHPYELPRPPQQPAPPRVPVGRVSRGSVHGEASTSRQAGPEGALAADVGSISLRSSGNNGDKGAGRGAWRMRQEDPVCRPAHVIDKSGTNGAATMLVANYFKVRSGPNWSIFQYHVDFTPDIENTRLRRGLMHVHRAILGAYNFDGATLNKMERFDEDQMELFSQRRNSEENIKINLRLVREVSSSDPIVMQILDVQMRRNMRTLRFQQLNRLYYDKDAASAIPNHNLELWPGFSTAIHQYDAATMMCTDLCFKILRSDTVLDQLMTFLRKHGPGQYQEHASRELIGCIILTRYNNSTYRIDDIAWDKNPMDKFTKGDREMTFVEYYQSHWNITIRDHQQPLLISMPKRRDVQRGRVNPILLIPELATMTGISDETRSNFSIMKDIATHTRVAPEERAAKLRGLMGRILGNTEVTTEMSSWGLSFEPDLIQFNGRLYAPENIHQAGGETFSYHPEAADWSKDMRNKRLLHTINLDRFLLIAQGREMQIAMSFVDTLRRVCGPMGINVNRPERVELPNDRATEFTRALMQRIQHGVQLAICVVPNNRKDRYDAIKKTCCVDHPVASQVIVGKTINKSGGMLMSVATKIGIQLNCKLGGAAWAVEVPIKNVMVIGYDSYHDSSQRGRSVGAICCSFNKTLTQYYSRVTFQTSREEMVAGLRTNIIAAIRYYHSKNSQMPDRIFVYRDGVSEGQLSNVKEFELDQIKNCFKEIGGNFNPRFTFIVVNKRITTRIFQKRGSMLSNPSPGTIVDSTITRPEFYDFYLVSQSVKQGTVTPTHYNIIHDESGMKPDHLQRLTYKLTHLYYNWPGTIRVPAPCLYAHKLAFLTGQSLHSTPSENLADTLYFL